MPTRERRTQGNYLKVNGNFELLGAGFEELNESPGAKSVSKRYINDKSETKTITGYDWASDYSIDQIRSEKAIEYICNIGEMLLTGADAETDYLIVDLDKPALNGGYRARKFKVAVLVKDFKVKDGEMQGSGSFQGKGDPVLGTFDTTTKEFVEGFSEKTLEFSYTATGTISAISVVGITYDATNHKFVGIPSSTTTFTFKDNAVDKTATLGSAWSVA